MGIFKRIKDWRSSRNTSSKALKPILLEVLEPRILLSGDGLLNISAPEPLRDPLLDGMEQTIQYAELLETNEEVGEQHPIIGQVSDQEPNPSNIF